ncbi:MAG: SDR family NAD(P)-dependent oxidoreductase [Pseudomonadota bacterium]
MGQRAVVTGASSGIGREFALQLAQQGYAVTVVARREPLLQSLIENLPGQGHHCVAADLARAEGVQAVADHLGSTRCNLLVNNAGYSVLQPFYESDLKVQQDMLEVNCGAMVTLSHHFLNQAERGDALINLSSIVAALPTPAQPVYSASKAFIASFSECLWEEQRSKGIYVMGLCPGVTQTGFIAAATGGESDGDTLPAALTQTTEQVVTEALAALGSRRHPIVVTGLANKAMVALLPRLLSRFRLIKTLAVMGDPERVL